MAAKSVALSLALHGLVAWRIAIRRTPPPSPPPSPPRSAIEFTLGTQRRSPPVIAATLSQPPLHPPPPQRPSRRRATPTSSGPEEGSPPPATTPPMSLPAAPAHIDLFSTDALRRAVSDHAPSAGAATLDPHGHLRRATDPTAPIDPGVEREAVTGRVGDMVGDAVGRERASSGNLPSRWRDIERALVQQFHPPVDVVRQEPRVKALAHQILRSWLDGPPSAGAVARGVDASNETLIGTPPGMNIRSMPGEQAAAIQSRWGAAATSLRVEVEVTLGADGEILRSRVVHPSGRRAFDRTALSAVVAAIRAGGTPDEKRTVVTRWSVEAAVAVAPPTAIGFRFDESGHLNPGATGIRKYLGLGPYPFEEQVQTKISLTSILPER